MSETYDIIFLILSSPVWWYFCHNFPFAHATNAQYIFPTVALGSRVHFRAVKQKKINDFYITVIYPIPEDFLCVGPSVWLILYFSSWRTSFNVSCGKAVPLFWWFVRCRWSLLTWAGLRQMLCLWPSLQGAVIVHIHCLSPWLWGRGLPHDLNLQMELRRHVDFECAQLFCLARTWVMTSKHFMCGIGNQQSS